MADRRVTIFPTSTPDGEDLAARATEVAKECGYDASVSRSPTQMDVARAAWGEGLVVFDATIEPAGHNYEAATYSLLVTPYSVVLSRSYLPANFRGHLEPIAPPYPEHWPTEVLIEKLRQRLIDVAPLFPKPASARSMKGLPDVIESAQTLVREKREASFDVFLSYRGAQTPAARQLVEDSLRQHGQRVHIVRTDDLSWADEVLSLQRRWQILRGIFNYLSAAREFWVLWSDDYLASWWTQGELVALANMTKEKRPALRIRSIGEGDVVPAAETFTPRLTRKQRRTIVERFLLCNLPESIVRIRKLAHSRLARVLLGLSMNVMLEPSFMETPMLECTRCAQSTPSVRALDVDGFLKGGEQTLRPMSPWVLAQARESGVLSCPVCGAGYRITSGPSRYWWYPVRGEHGTGPGGMVLEESPLCRASLLQ